MTKRLLKGNEAFAEAAVRAGCEGFFGYPITPSTEFLEYMSKAFESAPQSSNMLGCDAVHQLTPGFIGILAGRNVFLFERFAPLANDVSLFPISS